MNGHAGGDPHHAVVIRFDPTSAFRAACVVIAALVLMSVLADLTTSSMESTVWKAASLDSESSLATVYAILQVGTCAAAAFLVSFVLRRRGRPWAGHWFAVGLLLVAVAVEEQVGWHETLSHKLTDAWDTSGLLRFAWVLPGVVVVGLLTVVFLRFVVALPPPIRGLVVAAASVYVAGAVGVEMFSGLADDGRVSLSTAWVALTTLEETLELLGVALMGYAIGRYLTQFAGPVTVTTATPVTDARS